MSSASTQYCPNCGASNPIDARSCWNCGQALPTSDERQELWATREAVAGRDAPSGDPTDDDSGPEGNGLGGSRPWSGAATEPFRTPETVAPSTPRSAEGARTGDTRTFPTTWGAPNPDSGRRRASGSGNAAAGPPMTTPQAGNHGYGPPETSEPPSDVGGSGQMHPGYGQSGRGQSAYPSWDPGVREEFGAGQPESPYAPGGYTQIPYGQPEYGDVTYGQPPGYGGGIGPGGPIIAAARGPSGCLLGALGIVLIALLGAVLVAIVAYNAATGDQLRDGLRDVAATEVTRTGPVDVPQDGRLRVSEADVNRTIRRYTDDYGAISDPTLNIDPQGVVLNFSVLGINSSYRAGLVADGGQLRLTDPRASGAASRVLGAGDMASIVEPSLNDILRQSGVTATGVELGDGELTVLTAGSGATPAAGTPVATPVTGSVSGQPASVVPSDAGSAAPATNGSAVPSNTAPNKPRGNLIGIFGASGSAAPSAASSVAPSG